MAWRRRTRQRLQSNPLATMLYSPMPGLVKIFFHSSFAYPLGSIAIHFAVSPTRAGHSQPSSRRGRGMRSVGDRSIDRSIVAAAVRVVDLVPDVRHIDPKRRLHPVGARAH